MWIMVVKANAPESVAPCAGATRRKYAPLELRALKDGAEYEKKFGTPWKKVGRRHGTTVWGAQSCISRELPEKREGWFVAVKSLAALVAFARRVGGTKLDQTDDGQIVLRIG